MACIDPWRCHGPRSRRRRSLLRYVVLHIYVSRAYILPSILPVPSFTNHTHLRPGRSPTSATSESTVGLAKSGMPWENNASEGKYRYHPGGDGSLEPKDAPSAINVVVIPNVDLPKVRKCASDRLLSKVSLTPGAFHDIHPYNYMNSC